MARARPDSTERDPSRRVTYDERVNEIWHQHREPGSAIKSAQVEDPTLPTITPHDLRHTAASLAIGSQASAKAVQRMLGHASAAMTLDVYADLLKDDLDAVSDRLDEARQRAITRR